MSGVAWSFCGVDWNLCGIISIQFDTNSTQLVINSTQTFVYFCIIACSLCKVVENSCVEFNGLA